MYKTILLIFSTVFFSLLFISCGDGERVSTDGGVHQGIHGTKDTAILQPKDSVVITPD